MEDLSAGQAGSATCRSSKTLVTSRSEHRSGPLSISSRSFSPHPTGALLGVHRCTPSWALPHPGFHPVIFPLPTCAFQLAPAPRGLPSPAMVTHPGIRSTPCSQDPLGSLADCLGQGRSSSIFALPT